MPVAWRGLRAVASLGCCAALGCCVTLLTLLAGCQKPAPQANPHYVLDAALSVRRHLVVPAREPRTERDRPGRRLSRRPPPLTTDGEVFGQGALAAAHPTLQLPAIARLTDLETGRSVLVRINDRGTPTPRRLVQVTKRIASLLGMPADGRGAGAADGAAGAQ